MARYLVKRFASRVILVIIISSVTYLLASATLDPRAEFEGRRPIPPEYAIDRQLDALNLNPDTPILVRYGRWLNGVAHGDLGKSIKGTPINAEFGSRVWVSVQLLVLGTVLGLTGGILVGAWGAVRQYRFSDRFITTSSFILWSIPTFVLAIMLMAAAVEINNAVGVRIFQYVGPNDPTATGFWEVLGSRMQHLVLPTATLVITQVAFYSRYQRSTMLDALGSDFLRTARAKGLRKRQALLKHGLRVAVIPVVTLVVYDVALLFAGATFIEVIFTWHGMGEWFIQAVQANDVNVVATVSLFVAVLVLVANIILDLLQAALDPRVRAGAAHIHRKVPS